MKDGDSSGSTSVVVAATTSSASSSSSSSSSNASASVAPPQQPSGASSSSSSSSSVESCGLARWQCGTVRDPHSSSDTDDCDLDLDLGRLVIDLEADLDSKSLASGAEMKSSGVPQKSTTSSTFAGITAASTTHCASIPVACNNSSDANLHLNRTAKVAAPTVTDALKTSSSSSSSSHRSVMKNAQSNSNFIPVSTVQGDFADRGIKMRIKCGQSAQSSSSGGQTSKHEIFQFHSPFLTSSVENAATTTDFAAGGVAGDRSAHGSTNLGKSNCSRSAHKKDRHSTKDRSKVGRSFADELAPCNNSSSALSSSLHSNCATVASKETADALPKSDPLSGDGGLSKISASLSDPYEFNMKTEDTVGLPVKKMKLERCDVSNSPIPELCLPGVEKRDVSLDASHIGTITEPECLGPCEPGTSVTLEGIVWNETENGLLVVNVTWRGKTYVGTLMDSTKHHWAPPRFSGDSPTSDFETRTPKGRGKRGRTCAVTQRNEGNGSDRKLRSNRFSKPAPSVTAPSPVRNDGNSLKRTRPDTSSSDGSRGAKCTRSDSQTSESTNGSAGTVGELLVNGGMIECPEENCSKKYRNLNGLRYHQTRAHKLSCAALAKETNDLDASKYINDDFIENSTVVNKVSQKSRNLATETSSSSVTRKSSHSLNKPVEAGGKTEEPLEELDLETKSNGDDITAMEQEVKEHITNSEKVSYNVLANADAGYKALGITTVEEPQEQSRNRGCTSFPLVSVDDSRNLGITHQPLVALTPLPVRQDGSSASFQVQPSVTITQSAVPVGQSDSSFPPGSSSVDELAPGDSARDRDKVKKSKVEKTDRSKLKTSDSVLRPVVPVLTTPSTTVATTKPVILSPCLMLPSVSAQLKLIQPKPVLPADRTSLDANLTVVVDKNKKRKRDKEKQKLESVPCAAKPAAVGKPGAGSELSESDQLTSQNNTPTAFSGSVAATFNDSGIAQVKSSPATPIPVPSSTEGFGQPTTPLAPSSDQAPSGPQPEPSPAMGVLQPCVLHPANIADPPVVSQTDTVTQNDSSSKTTSSNSQSTLSASTLGNQHVLLPMGNLNMRPIVSLQSSPKVGPSSVIKTTSSFDANANLPVEPKPLSASDGEIPGQSVVMDRKLSVLSGTNNDFSTKTDEPGAKPVPDGLVQPASSLNLPSSASPLKKAKAAGAKHAEADSVAEFVDPHSPAYSDISDANDNAPLLDAPMLEKEAQAAAEEETAGSKVSPNNTQDSYVYSPFYGQPPYLTPAVPSSDHAECGPVLKPPLAKPLLEKHQVVEKSKTEAVRSRANEIPLKFAGEQPPRGDEKEARDKLNRVMNSGPTPGTTRTDVHKSQQHQQQQHQPHKMFTGETVLPQHMTMMPHMIMPSTYAFSTPFGLFNADYNEHLQRLYQQQIQQQHQEARRHDHALVSKPQVEVGGDHGKSRSTAKVSVEGKHSDEKFKPAKFEGMLPTPPSLIPDRNRHELKEELDKPDRNRDKQAEGRKPAKDGVEIKNMADAGVGIKREGFEMKMLAERQDIPRYCLQPHFLEQQQRLGEQQSHKGAAVEPGAGGCKPSAVVAPQTRDKIMSVGGMIGGTAAVLHGTKQPRDDSQGRSHDNHRAHRDAQKNPPMTPPQQQSLPQHKGAGSSRDGSSGRTPKETGERPGIKDDPGPSGSRGVSLKGKEDTPMTSLPISMPPGIPAPYASYYGHYLPAAAYTGAMPFDPSHAATLYPGMMGYPPPPYIHPAQMLSPALAIASAEGKPCEIIPQSHQPASFFANEGQPHKIHELKEVAKMQQQQGDSRSLPSPGNRDSARPKSRSGGSHSAGKDNDHSSPPTQRHLHTHHHMHVVSPLYPYVHSDATLIATQQAAATAATQLPRPFLAK